MNLNLNLPQIQIQVGGGYKRAALLGREVARRREAKGLTQTQLAQRCGLRQETLSRIERGKANPTAETLERLAEALDARLVIEFV